MLLQYLNSGIDLTALADMARRNQLLGGGGAGGAGGGLGGGEKVEEDSVVEEEEDSRTVFLRNIKSIHENFYCEIHHTISLDTFCVKFTWSFGLSLNLQVKI